MPYDAIVIGGSYAGVGAHQSLAMEVKPAA